MQQVPFRAEERCRARSGCGRVALGPFGAELAGATSRRRIAALGERSPELARRVSALPAWRRTSFHGPRREPRARRRMGPRFHSKLNGRLALRRARGDLVGRRDRPRALEAWTSWTLPTEDALPRRESRAASSALIEEQRRASRPTLGAHRASADPWRSCHAQRAALDSGPRIPESSRYAARIAAR